MTTTTEEADKLPQQQQAQTEPVTEPPRKKRRAYSSGRPVESKYGRTERLSVCLPEKLIDKFRSLGGSTWLREKVIQADVEKDSV